MRHLTLLLSALLLTGGLALAQSSKAPVTTDKPGKPPKSEAASQEEIRQATLRFIQNLQNAPLTPPVEPEIVPDPANSKPLKKIEPRSDELPERGLDHQRVKWVGEVLDEQGKRRLVTNSYIQLETGLNHYDAKGGLVPSDPNFELTADGAIAWKGQHRVSLTGSPHGAGAVQIRMPDNRLLVGNVVGLAYYDAASSKAVMIAEVQKAGGWLTNPNQVTYVDAFTGVKADLRYTSSRSGLEQDVILRETPPDPRIVGLDPATVRLEVWTEFTDAPEPKLTKRARAGTAGGVPPSEADDEDETIDFTGMRIGEGQAFSIGQEGDRRDVEVKKRWLRTKENRMFLIEAVDLSEVKPELDRLPKGRAELPKARSMPRMQALLTLPRKPAMIGIQAGIRRPSPEQASTLDAKAGFVLDFVSTIAPASYPTGFTFQGDTTYNVKGFTAFSGPVVLEGGAVIKFGKYDGGSMDPRLYFNGPFTCRTSTYRPAVFTVGEDDTVGDRLPESNGIPGSGPYASIGLRFYAAPPVKIENVRFLYHHDALSFHSGDSNSVVNAQFVSCGNPIGNSGTGTVGCYNVLVQDVTPGTPVFSGSSPGTLPAFFGEHMTLRNASMLRSSCNVTLKNSLVVEILDPSGLIDAGQALVLPSATGVFQTAGGGQNYLASTATGQSYRDVGVTTIVPELTKAFQEMTTYAPTYSISPLSPGTAVAPVVDRDVDVPDLGYHYPALDFVFWSVSVAGGTVTLTNGVCIGFFNGGALYLGDGGVLASEGRPDRLNRIVSAQLVQEHPGPPQGKFANAIFWSDSVAPNKPTVRLRFTAMGNLGWSSDGLRNNRVVAIEPFNGTGVYPLREFSMSDCQLGDMSLSYYPVSSTPVSVNFSNVLFERGRVDIGKYFAAYATPLTVNLRNNLFWQASLALSYRTSAGANPAWSVTDNIFDNAYALFDADATGQAQAQPSYNGFVNSTSANCGASANNQYVTTFNYEPGPLGNWYQGSTVFVNAGSRTADAAGLYQYTTQAKQTKEAASVVDLGFHYPASAVVTPSVTGQQGLNGWYFRYCSVVGGPPDNDLPSWDGNKWYDAAVPNTSSDYYTFIGNNGWMHPGLTRDPALVYKLPGSGRVFLRAVASDIQSCGTGPDWDGVRIRAMYDATPLSPWTVVGEMQANVAYNASTSAVAGHQLAFILNNGVSNSCDSTTYSISLSFDRPADTDGDGIPDYLEDRNGNGVVDGGETNWQVSNGVGAGATALLIFTPLN